jgi:hypothetical protein
MLSFEFRSHDRFVSHKNDHEIKIRNNACLGFDLMIKVLPSWLILLDKIRPHEQTQFENGNFDLHFFEFILNRFEILTKHQTFWRF